MKQLLRRLIVLVLLGCALGIQMTGPALASTDARSEIVLGNQAAQRQAWDLAIKHFSKAINSPNISKSNLAVAYNNRGSAWDDKKETKKALADYSKALELDPKYHEVYYNRSYTFERIDKFNLALKDAQKALEISPDDEHYQQRVKYLEAKASGRL